MKNNSIFFLTTALAICACTAEFDPAAAPDYFSETASAKPGEAYIFLSEECADNPELFENNMLESGMGVVSIVRVIPDGGKFDKRHHEAGLHRWYTVNYSKAVTETKASAGFSEINGVETVVMPRKKKLCSLPDFNDPEFEYQWNLHNEGNLSETEILKYAEGCDIDVLKVWEEYTAGSKDVIVAVLDEAADVNNPDLKDVVIPPGEHGSRSFVYSSGDYELDPGSHGCNVCSIIGAVGNNGYGLAGVAGGKDGSGGVRILSLALFDDWDAASDDNILKALVYAADEGAVICNNSWGYIYETEDEAKSDLEKFLATDNPLKCGIDYFTEYAGIDENNNQVGPMAGGLVIFSTGNDGFRCSVPAAYDNVIAVAAHGPNFNFEDYCNYGDFVDIVAPGGDDNYEEDAKWPFGMVVGVTLKHMLAVMCGTSQAAPHVAGVAALLVSYFGGPGFTNATLWDCILGGAKEDVLTGNMTGPMLDAYASFKFAEQAQNRIKTSSLDFRCNFASHESYDIHVSVFGNTDNLPITVETRCKAVSYSVKGDKLTISINALLAEPGTYPVIIYVGKGTPSEYSDSFEITIEPNNAPVASGKLSDILTDLTGNYNFDLDSYFYDADGEELEIGVTAEGAPVTDYAVRNGFLTIKVKGYGNETFTVTAKDARGESASQTFNVISRDSSNAFEVYPNPATDVVYVRTGKETTVSVELVDSYGKVVLSQNGKSSPAEPMKLNVAPLSAGQYTAKILTASTGWNYVNLIKL